MSVSIDLSVGRGTLYTIHTWDCVYSEAEVFVLRWLS